MTDEFTDIINQYSDPNATTDTSDTTDGNTVVDIDLHTTDHIAPDTRGAPADYFKKPWYIARGPDNYVWAMWPAEPEASARTADQFREMLGDAHPDPDAFRITLTEPIHDLTLMAVYWPQSAHENL